MESAREHFINVENMPEKQPRRSVFLGYAFAVLCLIWVLHSVDFSALISSVSTLNLKLVTLAILLDVFSYAVQGWRWSLLLRSNGKISVFDATKAIYAGLFVNEVLPLKLGEAFRAFLAAKNLQTNILKILPTIIAERFFDAFWLVAGIAAAAFFVSLPANLIEADEILGAVIILMIGIVFLIVRRSKKREKLIKENLITAEKPTTRRNNIGKIFAETGEQIRAVSTQKGSLAAFGLSLVLLFLQAASFWLIIRAYHIEISPAAGLVVFLIVQIGSAIPAAPANVGSFQFFTVLGLTLFGVDKTNAAGFSLVVFLLLTIPLWILGFLALSHSGFSIADVRREMSSH